MPLPVPMPMPLLVLLVSGTRRKGWKELRQLEFSQLESSQAMLGPLLWQQQMHCRGKSLRASV